MICLFPTDTSALLRAPQQISPGVYRISLVVTDSQGRRCETPESLTLEVCQCDSRDTCGTPVPTKTPSTENGKRSSWRLGPAAIGLLLLGLLMLLCEYAKASLCLYPVPAPTSAELHAARAVHLCNCLRGKAGGKWHFLGELEMFKVNMPIVYTYHTAKQLSYSKASHIN